MLYARMLVRLLSLLMMLTLAMWGLSPQPRGASAGPTGLFVEQWRSSEVGRASSVAWGDIDGDTDLDLAIGIETIEDPACECVKGGGVVVYDNQNGSLAPVPFWQSYNSEYARSVSFIDVNRDAFLDLFVADSSGSSRVYLGGDPQNKFRLAWSGPYAESYGAAWGDYDNDGDLDLFLANNGFSELYNNDTPAGSSEVTLTYINSTRVYIANDAAWGDYNNDTFLDLALATTDAGVILFRNIADPVRPGQRTLTATNDIKYSFYLPREKAQSVAWADYNADGTLDLAVGAVGGNILYKNSGGSFNADFTFSTGADNRTIDLAWADYDGDGKLDLALAQDFAGVAIYKNDSLPGNTNLAQVYASTDYNVYGLAWADYDKDGDQDLALATIDSPSVTYRNTRLEAEIKVATSFQGAPASGALIYRQLAGSNGLFTPYLDAQNRPVTTDGAGLFDAQGDIALGDRLVALLPAFQSLPSSSADVPKTIAADREVQIRSTLVVTQSGNIRDLNIVGLAGTHTFVSDLSFSLKSPSGKQLTFLSNECTTEDNFALNLDDEAVRDLSCPLTDANPARPQAALSFFDGEEAQGTWTLIITDDFAEDGGELTSWGLEIDTAPYQLFYTSAAPTEQGIDAQRVEQNTTQGLTISADNPLLLFDLKVSLEWDARNDPAYLDQLEFDLKRASELIYDWSDGQVALGTIDVYHNRQHWRDADVRVYATNRQRPNAQQGGVTREAAVDPASDEITYVPGQVRIGAVWNRFGNATGTVGEDWPRALAHELSHYLLYLDDNYLGLELAADGFDQLIAVDSCRGAMADPYRDDYTEFHPAAEWDALCAATLSNRETGRSDWETIRTFYSELRAPESYSKNRGPANLQLALTTVAFNELPSPSATFTAPLFNIVDSSRARVIPGDSARAYLFRDNDTIVDLGRPVRDQIEARGAEPGDSICLYEPAASRYGCSTVYANSDLITVYDAPSASSTWPFDVQITPVTTDTIRVAVTLMGLPANPVDIDGVSGYVIDPIQLSFYQPDLFAVRTASASPNSGSTIITGTLPLSATFVATIKAAGPIDTGYLRVQVSDNYEPARELVVDYSQIGVYDSLPTLAATDQPSLAQICLLPNGKRCPAKPAPTASADGQAFLYGRSVNLKFGSYYSLQGTLLQPPAPTWRVPAGRGYRFISSAGAEKLNGMSLNMSYLENDVPYGAEGGLAIYYLPASGGDWQRLPSTRFDPQRNDVSARLVGDGLYMLMTSVPLSNGWNLFAYPWQERTPLANALTRLNAGNYTTIYGYDPANSASPWQVYDTDAPSYVNSLTHLEYGRGYWLNIAGLPLTAQAANQAMLSADLAALVPTPPATYYGQVLASDTLSPTAGLKVQALIGEKVCGEATTQAFSNMIVFAVNVSADDGAGLAGCGALGRSVTFQIGAERLLYQVNWDNQRPRELRLVRLPIVRLPLAP